MQNVAHIGHIGKARKILLGKPERKENFEDILLDVQVLKYTINEHDCEVVTEYNGGEYEIYGVLGCYIAKIGTWLAPRRRNPLSQNSD